jgi:hypothetical protein
MMMNPQLPFGLANLNHLVEIRSEAAAFGNDFLFMFYLCLPAFAFIWFMRRPQFTAASEAKLEVME